MRLFSLKMVFSKKIVKYIDRDTFEKDCLFYFCKKDKDSIWEWDSSQRNHFYPRDNDYL